MRMKLFTLPSSRVLPSATVTSRRRMSSRDCSVVIGFTGIALTVLVAALAMQGLRAADGNLKA